jgi:hypothetical protein
MVQRISHGSLSTMSEGDENAAESLLTYKTSTATVALPLPTPYEDHAGPAVDHPRGKPVL